MGKYSDYLGKKNFPVKRVISEEDFLKKKGQLSEEEFNQLYIQGIDESGYPLFFEIIANNPTENEQTLFLLNEILAQQKVTAKKTRIIAGIVIFWLVCDIISGLAILITLSSLLD